jgi:hypothetical protein
MRRKNTKRFDPRYFMDEKMDKVPEPSEEQPECGPDETWNKDTQKCVEMHEALTDRNPAEFRDDWLDRADPQDQQRWADTALPSLPRWMPKVLTKLGLVKAYFQSDEEYEAALTDMFGEEMAMAIAAAEPEAQE